MSLLMITAVCCRESNCNKTNYNTDVTGASNYNRAVTDSELNSVKVPWHQVVTVLMEIVSDGCCHRNQLIQSSPSHVSAL